MGMTATVQFDIDGRWGKDAEALRDRLLALVAEQGAEGISTWLGKPRRGSDIRLTWTVTGEREAIQDQVRFIGNALNNNANLVDRIDWFRIHTYADNKILAVSQGDNRGWLRQAALDDLKEVNA